MRIFDDNDVDEREGPMRSIIDNKHKDAINFVDFRQEHEMTATASDDGQIILYNHKSRRFEGQVCPPDITDLPEVKICKFLEGHDVIVSSDLDGYLNFYSIYPSTVKNQLLARVQYINENEQIKREGETKPVQN